MKVLILAAGYGTRLARDLEQTEQYLELRGVPKPLLPIGGRPLISHWMTIIQQCPSISMSDVCIVVNESNRNKFEEWAKDYPGVKLVCDRSTCNDERLGAVACINLGVKHYNIHDDLIVIGGDTLFLEDFSLQKVIDKFKTTPSVQSIVTYYKCNDEDTTKCGILEVDENGRVTSFLEKPTPDSTISRNACPCFYLLSSQDVPLLQQFLDEYKDVPLSKRDATGHFIKYLCSKQSVYALLISGRFDVGNLQSYIECNEHFKATPTLSAS